MTMICGYAIFVVGILRNALRKKQKGETIVRASWDEYFMEIAEIVKTRATCLRRQVGAVIVKDNRIITTGYNGAPAGLKHCTEMGGCERQRLGIPSGERHELCRALHAEQNAIIQAAKLGISTEGATIYITLQPCVICAKMLINALSIKGNIPMNCPERFWKKRILKW